jgi:manganese/zinc/iron transport system permease protein
MGLSVALLVNTALTVAFWKEIKLVCFDPALATAMGLSAGLVHFGLMGTVAATTVASFESVGSILVVAMLVAPGATAHLLTDRLARMVPLSALLAASCAVVGHLLALALDTNIAGMMSVVAGVQFGIATLLAPRYGIIPVAIRRLNLALRIEREDLLADLFRQREATHLGNIQPRARAVMPPTWRSRLAERQLRTQGHIITSAKGLHTLTPSGEHEAARIIRSHRLWEAFLSARLQLATDHLHDPSERMEHLITPEIERALREEFARTEHDPQGKPIP